MRHIACLALKNNLSMPRYAIIILFVCSLSLYFLNLSKTDIYILDEVKNSVCAYEMAYGSPLFVPTFNTNLRTDKPPLHYFFMEIGYLIFGYNELGARFFSGVAGIVLVFLVFYYTGMLLGKKTAWLTSLVLLSSTFISIQFRLAVPDPYLILLLFLTLVHLYLHIENKGSVLWLYVFAALAFLAKGLVAIVFPALIFIVYMLVVKRFTVKSCLTVLNWKGLLVFLLIVSPWFVYVGIKTNGAWLEGFFLDHHVNRFLETREGHRGFPGLAILYAWMAVFPFGVWVFSALFKKKAFWIRNKFLLFSFISVGVIVIFFSFSRTLLPSYISPAVPFLSILIGHSLKSKQIVKNRFRSRLGMALLIILSLTIPIAVYFSIKQELPNWNFQWFKLAGLLLLPVSTFLTLHFYMNRNKWGVVYIIFIAWYLFNISVHTFLLPDLLNKNAVKIATEKFNLHHKNDSLKVVAYKNFNPAFVWYLKSPIEVLPDSSSLNKYINGGRNVLVLTDHGQKNDLYVNKKLFLVFRQKELFENGEVIIYANTKQ